MARPELGIKRLCPNCGTKYYDLNHDPIVCPKCNAAFATGIVGVRPDTANDDDEDVDLDDEGVELVALEEAVEEESDDADAIPTEGDDDVDVGPDDDVLVDDVDDDEVSDVVRGTDEEDEEER